MAQTTLYVDPNFGSDSNDGAAINRPYKTLMHACGTLTAGSTLILRGGNYVNDICVASAQGTPQKVITIEAFTGEKPIITGTPTWGMHFLLEASWYVVSGLTFQNTLGDSVVFSVMNANNVTLNNLTFLNNSGDTHIRLLQTDHITIQNSLFDGTGSTADAGSGDNIYLMAATHTLVQGNTFRRAGHAAIDLIDTEVAVSAYNVIRNNIIQQYWGGGIYLIKGTHDTIVDSNTISYVGNQDTYGKAALQIAAGNSIVRHNVIANTGTATNIDNGIALYAYTFGGVAQNAVANRIYNNDVYGSTHEALYIWISDVCVVTDNKIMNNIFYHNHTANDTEPYWPAGDYYLGFELYHTPNKWQPFPNNNSYLNNIILHTSNGVAMPGIPMAYYDYEGWSKSVTQLQTDYPGFFHGNLEQSPQFNNPANMDFSLAATSPAIDAGAFLTTTTAAGTSTNVIPVADAKFFTDGYGIIPGDQVQVGSNSPSIVLAVNLNNSTLTISRNISFAAGSNVSLPFNGKATDIGAIEFGRPPKM